MKNILKVGLGIFAIVTCIFVFLHFQKEPKVKKATEEFSKNPQLNYVIKMDRENLNNPKVNTDQKAKSIKRLALQKDPKVTAYAKEFWESGDITLQAAAVEAVGIFPHEGSRKIIKSALYSDNSLLVESALNALSRQGGTENEREIILFLENNKNSDLVYSANKALLIVAATDEGKSYALKQILSVANDLSNEKSSQALLTLYKYAPNTPSLGSKAKAAWNNYKDPLVWTRSLQFLDAKDTDWVLKNLTLLPLNESSKYTQVLIETLNKHCPSGANNFFKKIKNSNGFEKLNPKLNLKCP